MFEQVLPGNTKAILALLEKSEVIQKAYLAGGTALALQLGHRISYDLDFFTQEQVCGSLTRSGSGYHSVDRGRRRTTSIIHVDVYLFRLSPPWPVGRMAPSGISLQSPSNDGLTIRRYRPIR